VWFCGVFVIVVSLVVNAVPSIAWKHSSLETICYVPSGMSITTAQLLVYSYVFLGLSCHWKISFCVCTCYEELLSYKLYSVKSLNCLAVLLLQLALQFVAGDI